MQIFYAYSYESFEIKIVEMLNPFSFVNALLIKLNNVSSNLFFKCVKKSSKKYTDHHFQWVSMRPFSPMKCCSIYAKCC